MTITPDTGKGGDRAMTTTPNPDLAVGADGKPGWNRPDTRRQGFHQAYRTWRRMRFCRAPVVLSLGHAPDPATAARVAASGLTDQPAFSALVVAQGSAILHAQHAADFPPDQPHSVQSISKLLLHLTLGELVEQTRLTLADPVEQHLPWIGSAYRGASLGDIADMNIANDFTEDYADPACDAYVEELALGWRLPAPGQPEPTMRGYLAGLTGGDLTNRTGHALYKSANTDVLTMVAARLGGLDATVERIVAAAGFASGLWLSHSADGVPGFSGGACLTATDLARLGLLLARGGAGVTGRVGSAAFTARAIAHPGPTLPTRPWQRYARHLMTDGRFFGHSGYGGQCLLVDQATGRTAAYLSVLENESGYDADTMAGVFRALAAILAD